MCKVGGKKGGKEEDDNYPHACGSNRLFLPRLIIGGATQDG